MQKGHKITSKRVSLSNFLFRGFVLILVLYQLESLFLRNTFFLSFFHKRTFLYCLLVIDAILILICGKRLLLFFCTFQIRQCETSLDRDLLVCGAAGRKVYKVQTFFSAVCYSHVDVKRLFVCVFAVPC